MGTHHTKLMEMESIALYFVAKDARVLIHSATEHACWRGENNSNEHLAGPGVPEGGPQGRALCLQCWPRGDAGGGGTAGPTVAAGSHSPRWATC